MTLRERMLRLVAQRSEPEQSWVPLSLRQLADEFGCTRSHAYQIRQKLVLSGMIEQQQLRDPLTGQSLSAKLRLTDKGRATLIALDSLTPGQAAG